MAKYGEAKYGSTTYGPSGDIPIPHIWAIGDSYSVNRFNSDDSLIIVSVKAGEGRIDGPFSLGLGKPEPIFAADGGYIVPSFMADKPRIEAA